MESEAELANFLLTTCRICLCAGGKLQPLILSSNDTLDFIREVIGIEPELGDGLPQTICEECENNVKGCLGFFERCRNVDVYIQNLVIETRNNEAGEYTADAEPLIIEAPVEDQEGELSDNKADDSYSEPGGELLPNKEVKHEECVVSSSVVEETEVVPESPVEYQEQELETEEIEVGDREYEVVAEIMAPAVKEENKEGVKLEDNKPLLVTTDVPDDIRTELEVTDKKKRTNRKPTLCQICGRILSGKVTFQNHMRTHDSVKRYSCTVCQARFWTRKNLLTHLQIHSGDKRYGCVICGKMFRTYASCRYHQANHNKNRKEEPTYSCSLCEKTYKNKYNLIKHEKNHTSRDAEKHEIYYKCEECGGNFRGRNAYANHKKVHENKEIALQSKPFVCDVCGNKYRSKSNLYTHKQCHIMEQCPFCERTFSKTAFKTHVLTHTGGSNFECEICRKTYSQRFYLLKHMIRHKKNHFCTYCGQTFVSKKALIDHQMNDCNAVEFQCEICGTSFEDRPQLVQHIDREHVVKK